MAIVPRPEVVAAVAQMPPLTPTQLADLRQVLHDWPPLIAERVAARTATDAA